MHQFLDATYLKSAAQAGITEAENLEIVKSLTNEAIANNYKLLMIRAKYIPKVKQLLRIANAPTLIGTVIDFEGISATQWLVNGLVVGSGTLATPATT